MKTFYIGIAAVAALSAAPALAADMPLKSPPPPPPALPWTGFYLGGFVGDAFSRSVTTPDPVCQNTAGPCVAGVGYAKTVPVTYDLNSSVIAGGTFGYNWQTGRLVWGLENEIGYIRMRGTAPFTTAIAFGVVPPAIIANETAFSTLGNWYDAFTARFGLTGDTLSPSLSNALFYVKGGAAVSRFNTGVSSFNSPGFAFDLSNESATQTVWGFAAGGGVEWAFHRNWTVKAEYEYLGFHKTVQACANETTPAGAVIAAVNCTSTAISGISTAKVGFNYLFH